MNKNLQAKLVDITLRTRVIVAADATNQEIAEAVKRQLPSDIPSINFDNIEKVVDDLENPNIDCDSPLRYFKAIPIDNRKVYDLVRGCGQKYGAGDKVGSLNVDTGQIIIKNNTTVYIHQLADLTEMIRQIVKTSC